MMTLNEEANEERSSDLRATIRDVIQEFVKTEQARTEPAYKTELIEERKRREQLERRLNEVVEENRRSRQMAEEAERASAIRAELQRAGVGKIELALRAIREDVQRGEDGRFVVKGGGNDLGLKEYVAQFVSENPELLPARMSGGSGAVAASKVSPGSVDLDKIGPGMTSEELERARREVARVASQMLR